MLDFNSILITNLIFLPAGDSLYSGSIALLQPSSEALFLCNGIAAAVIITALAFAYCCYITYKACRQSEFTRQYFQAIIENSLEITLILDKDDSIAYASPSFQRLIILEPEKLYKTPIYDLLHDEDVLKIKNLLAEIKEKPDITLAASLRYKNSNNEFCAIEATFENFIDNDKIKGILINGRDVTERITIENKLLEKNSKYGSILENTNSAIIYHKKNGLIYEFVDANNEYKKIIELAESFLKSGKITETEKALFNFTQIYDSLISSNEKQLKYEQYFANFERWYDIIAYNTQADYFVTIITDITERKKTEASLRENEKLLRTLINSMPDIVCFKDAAGRWLEANEFTLKLFSLENVNYRGQNDSELAAYNEIYRSAFVSCEESDEKAWSFGTAYRTDEHVLIPSGKTMIFDIIKVPLFNPDLSRKGIVIIGRDITDLKNAENNLKHVNEKLEEIISERTAKLQEIITEFEVFLDILPQLYFKIDFNGTILNCRQGKKTSYYTPPETFLNKKVSEVLPEYVSASIYDALKKIKAGESIATISYHLDQNDKTDWFTGVISKINDSELAVIIRNITEQKQFECRLQKNLEKYKNIFEKINEAICIFSLNGDIIEANDMACIVLGYNRQELLNLNYKNIIIENTEVKFKDFFDNVINSEGLVSECNLANKNGLLINAELNARLIKSDEDYIVGIIREITGRKKIKHALQKSEEKNQALLSALPDLIFLMSNDGYYVELANNSNEALIRPIQEIIGKHYSEFLPTEVSQKIDYHIRELQNTGKIQNFEYQLTALENNYYEARLAPLDSDYFITIIRNITDRKKIEEELNEKTQTFYLMTSKAADAIIVINNDGNISFWNHAAENIFGYAAEEVIGQQLHTLIAPKEYHTKYRNGFEKFRTCGKGSLIDNTIEIPAIRKDGKEIVIEIALSAIQINGKWNAIGICRDITNKKRDEIALQTAKAAADAANIAKSRFLANMSHEIRTPLSSIIGIANLLKDSQLSHKQLEQVNILKDAGTLLLTIINDILDLSAIEENKFKINPSYFDLINLIETTIEIMKVKIIEKKLSFKNIIDPKIPAIVKSDSERLRQILINLISNAIKFTYNGGITVKITLKSLNEEKSTAGILFEVIDTGIGMNEDNKNKIFKPFFQVDMTNTRKFGGTGLGLSIAKKMVEILGGRIEVISQPNQGSNFYFELEMPYSNDKTILENYNKKNYTTNITDKNKLNEKNIKDKIILLAEDNKFNQKFIVMHLNKLGYTVDCAENGLFAFEMYKSLKYSIILMDCQMPVMDGYEATSKIRDYENQNSLAAIPILALTADAMSGTRENCIKCGMNEYMSKPLDFEKLDDLILFFTEDFNNKKNYGQPATSAASNITQSEKISSSGPETNSAGAKQTPDVNIQAGAAHPEKEILNQKSIAEIKKLQIPGKPNILKQFIDIYMADTPPKVNSIKSAVIGEDYKTLNSVAHNLKSSSANIGASAFAAICKELELFGKNAILPENINNIDKNELNEKMKIFENEYEILLRELNNLIATIK
ncbi:MAG: PAS domain S-box protein [Candidatus Wallbacteria bacterium]